MSMVDNLNEKSKAFFEKISERVRESSLYVQLQDRYETLTPSGQKLAAGGSIVLVLLFVLFIPLSNLLNSYYNLSMFEEKRNLIRELFRTNRESSSSNQQISAPPPAQSLKFTIESILTRAELLPEQNQGLTEETAEGRLIPQNLIASVLFVKLAKLNLKQIVDIGSSIASISDSVKMKDISIVANDQDTRYYDVVYKLYSLKVPEATPEPPPEIEPVKKKRNSDEKNDDESKTNDE